LSSFFGFVFVVFVFVVCCVLPSPQRAFLLLAAGCFFPSSLRRFLLAPRVPTLSIAAFLKLPRQKENGIVFFFFVTFFRGCGR
jgi:hypothetical protein